MYYILYNPLSAHGQGKTRAQNLKEILKGKEYVATDIREITDYPGFFAKLSENDSIIIAGGDGTLNRFANKAYDHLPKNDIYYYPAGSGNDFYHDISNEPDKMIRINKYLTNLPVVEVNGERHYFLNGIGYGIDGYCCEVGDALAKTSEGPVNYTSIAIKGLLFHYKPTNAKITVDGKTTTYQKVWLAPTMKGRYYGGGMMVAPSQDRLAEDNSVSSVVLHNSGKLKTLMVFPSIFKGEHIKHTDIVTIAQGHRVTVEFDRPTALQIDGETVLGVRSYTVIAGGEEQKTTNAEQTATV